MSEIFSVGVNNLNLPTIVYTLRDRAGELLWEVCTLGESASIRMPPETYEPLRDELLRRAPLQEQQDAQPSPADPSEGAAATSQDDDYWPCGDEKLRAIWVAKIINAAPETASAGTIAELLDLAHTIGRKTIIALLEDMPF